MEYNRTPSSMVLVSNGEQPPNKRYGYLNADGTLAVPVIHEFADLYHDGLALLGKKTDGETRYWYIDEKGEDVLTQADGRLIQYGDYFRDGYASVQLAGSEGNYIIDKNGAVILTPMGQQYYYLNLGGGFFGRYLSMNLVNPQGVVNVNGEVVYSGNEMLITPNNSDNGFYYTGADTYGFFDNKTFKPLTSAIFNEISPFENGVSLVTLLDDSTRIMNSAGEYTCNLSEQYPNIKLEFPYQFSGGVVALNFSDGKGSVIVSQSGELVAQTEYDEIGTFFSGLAVCKKGDKFGYVDAAGNERLEPIYDGATAVHKGIGFVTDGDRLFQFTDQ